MQREYALHWKGNGGENSLRGKVQRAGNPKHCKKIHCQGEEEDGVGRVVEVGRVGRHIAPAGPATHCIPHPPITNTSPVTLSYREICLMPRYVLYLMLVLALFACLLGG